MFNIIPIAFYVPLFNKDHISCFLADSLPHLPYLFFNIYLYLLLYYLILVFILRWEGKL